MELDNSDTIFNSPRWFFIAPNRGTLRNTRNWKGCSSLSKSPVVRQRHTPVNSCAAAPPLLRGAAPPTTRPHRGATSLMGISSSPSRFFYDFCNWSQRKERCTACRTQTPASRIVLSSDFLAPRKASKALTGSHTSTAPTWTWEGKDGRFLISLHAKLCLRRWQFLGELLNCDIVFLV